jgi:SSS family solute:Na+ symporter
VLGLIALFGYMARAVPAVNADVKADGNNPQLSVPLLFAHMFPSWFAGIGYSAIVIGALVPAAVMSIAAANLFTRTIYRELLRPYATPAQETRVARLASLCMKVGALGFALVLNKTFSINLQLLGGIWILQTFPAIVISLYTRWFHRYALIVGWAAGMVYGTVQAYRTPGGGQAHFGASSTSLFGHVTYIAIVALILNLAVSAVLTVLFRKMGVQDGYDETRPSDYIVDPANAPAAARTAATGATTVTAGATTAATAAAGASTTTAGATTAAPDDHAVAMNGAQPTAPRPHASAGPGPGNRRH